MNRRALQRFLHDRAAVVSLIVFALILLACLGMPVLGYSDYVSLDIGNHYAPVSLTHPFSTDNLGRDVFTRVMIGGRYTLGLSFLSTLITITCGTLLGILAGYCGGKTDSILMRISEAISAIPYILLVIFFEVSLGWGKGWFFLAIAFAQIPAILRTIRSAVLKIRFREYIEAARAIGKSTPYILFHHVLHNISTAILVQACSSYASAIISCSILGYLEFGISFPTPEWGRMVADYFHLVQSHGFLVVIPCVFISLSVLTVTLIGNGLRDAFDIRGGSHD